MKNSYEYEKNLISEAAYLLTETLRAIETTTGMAAALKMVRPSDLDRILKASRKMSAAFENVIYQVDMRINK